MRNRERGTELELGEGVKWDSGSAPADDNPVQMDW